MRFAWRYLLVVAAVVAGCLLLAACGSGAPSRPSQTPEPKPATPGSTVRPSTTELAQATVQIWALSLVGDAFEPISTGSGSIISEDGLVLTNAHVVGNRVDEYDRLAVAVLNRIEEPPEMAYLAEVASVDYALDLAVIRIVSDLDGSPTVVHLPTVELGDSDDVEIGDHIRILGYPGIGGETITFTDGVVSGFTSERGLSGRAWIKTDATIAGGNSGGMAVNDQGKLIGVPTIAGAGSDEQEPVDCRYVADTNRDGEINDLDSCVPVGGFINGLRPLNLATPLVEAAEADDEYVGLLPVEPEPAGGFDTSQVIFRNLLFADGVTAGDQPTQIWDALPSGVTQVCAFWDYEGMADSMTWGALWFVDGQVNEEGSIIDNSWTGGDSGNWWVCTIDYGGLPDSLYEVVLSVEGEVQRADAVFVGGDHSSTGFTIVNESRGEICYAFISPAGAQHWGQDDLGRDQSIEPGTSHTWLLPAGTYDLMLQDCGGETLAEEYGLDLAQAPVYTLTSPSGVSPSPTTEQVTPAGSRRQLKLDDAPYYLDVSAVLPGFRQLDPHQEGISNQDLGLGADFSEVVTYLSEEPYQATFMFMYVASGEFEKASARAELRDVRTLEEQFLAGFYEGVGDEGVETSISWSDPAVGDTAKLARLTADFWGAETDIEAVIFLQEEGQEAALVFLLNLWYPFEPPKVDTLTIAREISARITNR